MSLYSGPFLESSLLPWQGYTVSVIRSGLCSTGCCFTILTNLLQNMRIVSRESTAIFVQSFKKLLSGFPLMRPKGRYRRSQSYRQDYRSPQAYLHGRTASSLSDRPEGAVNGSRREGRVFLREFMTAFC